MNNSEALGQLVDAIQDLTRVTIAFNGKFESKAETVRALIKLGIAPSRVAALLGIPAKSVHAELAKAKRRTGRLKTTKSKAR